MVTAFGSMISPPLMAGTVIVAIRTGAMRMITLKGYKKEKVLNKADKMNTRYCY